MNYLPHTIIRKFACDSRHLPILNWKNRQMAWLFVWTLLHLLSLLTTAFGCITFITNILFLSTTLLTRVWRTFNGKWKELFHDACLWSAALFIMQKWEWGRIEGWRDETNHFCQTYASSQPSRRTWHNIWYSIILGNKHSHASCIFITFARLDVN